MVTQAATHWRLRKGYMWIQGGKAAPHVKFVTSEHPDFKGQEYKLEPATDKEREQHEHASAVQARASDLASLKDATYEECVQRWTQAFGEPPAEDMVLSKLKKGLRAHAIKLLEEETEEDEDGLEDDVDLSEDDEDDED